MVSHLIIASYVMSKHSRSTSVFALAIGFSQLFTAFSAVSHSQTAEEFMDAGHLYVNYIRLSGASPAILETYGRVSGDSETSVPVSDLTKVQSISGGAFSGGIYLAPEFESLGNRFNSNSEDSPDFQGAAIEIIDEIIRQLPAVSELDPYIRIVSAPLGSGVSVHTEQSIDAERTTPITFIVSMDNEQSVIGFDWWKSSLEMIAHELLHLQHKIAPPDPRGRQVDREAAAYLYGQCAISGYASKLGASTFEVSIEINHQAWSGIEAGKYSPKMRRIRQIGNASRQGRTLAFGYLYHLVPEAEGVLNLTDEKIQRRLFSTCQGLPASVPLFSRGLD